MLLLPSPLRDPSLPLQQIKDELPIRSRGDDTFELDQVEHSPAPRLRDCGVVSGFGHQVKPLRLDRCDSVFLSWLPCLFVPALFIDLFLG